MLRNRNEVSTLKDHSSTSTGMYNTKANLLSPSTKRTSKLFSGKRSVDLNTHNGLKVNAESYKNLHAAMKY